MDATNIKMGPCQITYKGENLGHTKGGVTVTYTPEYYDIMVDKYGNTVVDKVLIGESLKATVPLSEFTVENLLVAMPAAEEGGVGARATIGKDAGEKMAASAGALILHPLINAANNRAEDVVLYKAIVAEEIEVAHNWEGEKLIEVTFQALIDESKASGNRLGLFGDSV
jgi:hypothetical protein